MSSSSLLRKLENHESIIKKMFNVKWNNDGSLLLEKKISQLEELIADFPINEDDQSDQLAEEWRDKVIVLWEMYIKLSSAKFSPEVINDATISSTTAYFSFSPAVDSSIPDGRCAPRRPSQRWHSNVVDVKLMALFLPIPPESVGNSASVDDDSLEDYKSLLEAVAKAYHLTQTDTQRQYRAFELAFEKLQPDRRRSFTASFQHKGKDLKSLLIYLRDQITARQMNIRREGGGGHMEPGQTVAVKDFDQVSDTQSVCTQMSLFGGDCVVYQCRYCKQYGHLTDNCPDIRALLCFNCYQRGHTGKKCPNEPLFIV